LEFPENNTNCLPSYLSFVVVVVAVVVIVVVIVIVAVLVIVVVVVVVVVVSRDIYGLTLEMLHVICMSDYSLPSRRRVITGTYSANLLFCVELSR